MRSGCSCCSAASSPPSRCCSSRWPPSGCRSRCSARCSTSSRRSTCSSAGSSTTSRCRLDRLVGLRPGLGGAGRDHRRPAAPGGAGAGRAGRRAHARRAAVSLPAPCAAPSCPPAPLAALAVAACGGPPSSGDFRARPRTFIEDEDSELTAQFGGPFTDATCEEPADTTIGTTVHVHGHRPRRRDGAVPGRDRRRQRDRRRGRRPPGPRRRARPSRHDAGHDRRRLTSGPPSIWAGSCSASGDDPAQTPLVGDESRPDWGRDVRSPAAPQQRAVEDRVRGRRRRRRGGGRRRCTAARRTRPVATALSRSPTARRSTSGGSSPRAAAQATSRRKKSVLRRRIGLRRSFSSGWRWVSPAAPTTKAASVGSSRVEHRDGVEHGDELAGQRVVVGDGHLERREHPVVHRLVHRRVQLGLRREVVVQRRAGQTAGLGQRPVRRAVVAVAGERQHRHVEDPLAGRRRVLVAWPAHAGRGVPRGLTNRSSRAHRREATPRRRPDRRRGTAASPDATASARAITTASACPATTAQSARW